MYVFVNYIILEDGGKVGPFSSHWAAVAAMLRYNNSEFINHSGDKSEDLALEKMIRE